MHPAVLTSAALLLLVSSAAGIVRMERSGGFVKLSNGIWWPAMLEQTKGEHDNDEKNTLNPFHVIASASDVIVAHLLGEDQVAALKVTDRGVSWDVAHEVNTTINQDIPATLQHQYDHAVSLLDAQLIAEQTKAADYGAVNSIIAINSQVPSSSGLTSGPSTILGKRRIASESPSASAFVLDGSSSSSSSSATDDGIPESLLLVGIPQPGLPESLCPLVQHNHPSHFSHHSHELVLKRSDALPWDDYFMAVAYLSAMRSKDPNTQVGACIVNDDKRIVGIGYNGFPRGCSDDGMIVKPYPHISITFTNTQLRAHTLTHPLTHSLTHQLTHFLTHQLTHTLSNPLSNPHSNPLLPQSCRGPVKQTTKWTQNITLSSTSTNPLSNTPTNPLSTRPLTDTN